MKILRDKAPVNLHYLLKEMLYSERRDPHRTKFYDNSRSKVGRQKLGNNIKFMEAIKDEWLGKNLTIDTLRMILKRAFFYFIIF